MWKPSQSGNTSPSFTPESSRPAAPASSVDYPNRAPAAAVDQASIGKSLFIKGEITGSESLFIDGKVEGTIALPGNRVTVGRNGQVASSITAREIVILGKVRGNIAATDRVDIRAEGALTGDVTAARISIEDGAYFKGGIDIKKADAKPSAEAKPTAAAPASASPESPKSTQQ
jgi:cytoskeletal protein CcmA (bactofilin family)